MPQLKPLLHKIHIKFEFEFWHYWNVINKTFKFSTVLTKWNYEFYSGFQFTEIPTILKLLKDFRS